MKKIMFVALALLMGLASCVKDKQYPGINISNVSYSPTAVTEYTDVTVSATITSFKAVTAKLYYVTTEEPMPVAMTEAEGVFTGVIPAQPDGTVVKFYVEAENDEMTVRSSDYEYEVGAVAIDYSVLRLNELNGHEKFIEIFNAGTEAINLNGAYIEKDGTQNWVGTSNVTVEAGGYLVLLSEDVIDPNAPQVAEDFIFHSGLSAKKNVRIQLFTPAGVSIDDFNLTNIDLNGEAYGSVEAPASYSRNADGNWYYADATMGAANVDGVNPVLGLEGGITPEPPTPEEPDYTNLVLNELNGDTKFIEFYNKGDLELSLEGMFITKDGNEEDIKWTGDATHVIPAHGYLVLYSIDTQADHPELADNMFFNSGLSAKKSVRIAFYMADGTERDVFERESSAAPGEWGASMSNVAPQSYARTPDGGDWKLADPTPGEANPATGDDIPQE
ncbi:MAG: lamin tail domain-containing protein [Bacteroidales bacterium]|nr:lamin tail domain-containing protein [Bacteroidales bacterium]